MSVSVVAMEWAVCLALCTALFRLRASLCAEGTTDLRVPLSARGVLLRLQTALLASLLLTLGAIWAGARAFQEGCLFAGGLCAALLALDAACLSKRRGRGRLLRGGALLALLSLATGLLVELMT